MDSFYQASGKVHQYYFRIIKVTGTGQRDLLFAQVQDSLSQIHKKPLFLSYQASLAYNPKEFLGVITQGFMNN